MKQINIRGCSGHASETEGRSAAEAPETLLDLERPDPMMSEAAGEVVVVGASKPTQPVRLLVVLGRALVHDATLESSTISIGRDSGQDLVIDDASVSRRHCQLAYQRGAYLLKDLGTSNGTTLNGRPAISEALIAGDEIGIGRYVLIFCPTPRQLGKVEYRVNALTRDSSAGAATHYLSHGEIDSVRRAVSAEREAHLLCVGRHGGLGQRIALATDGVVLGCGRMADVPVRGLFVRAHHAEILQRGGAFVIERRSAFRRVYLNGHAINRAELRSRDQIRIGRSIFQFFEPAR